MQNSYFLFLASLNLKIIKMWHLNSYMPHLIRPDVLGHLIFSGIVISSKEALLAGFELEGVHVIAIGHTTVSATFYKI
jgi:hypothetical protein